jgi:hypothetical protein
MPGAQVMAHCEPLPQAMPQPFTAPVQSIVQDELVHEPIKQSWSTVPAHETAQVALSHELMVQLWVAPLQLTAQVELEQVSMRHSRAVSVQSTSQDESEHVETKQSRWALSQVTLQSAPSWQ